MKISEATEFQGAFDAVMSGAASDAQCKEVIAVAHVLGVYIREVALRAKALPERRTAFASLLDATSAAKLDAALPIDTTTKPRIELDTTTGEVKTPAPVVVAVAPKA